MFHGNESGARQGSSCKDTYDNFSHVLNDDDEQVSSHVLNYDLSENESIHSLVNNLSTFVVEQDTSEEKIGLTNKYMAQSPVNQTNVVHGTVFTVSDRAGDSTLAAEGATTGYHCLQPFGFIKRVANITMYHLKDFSRSIIVSLNNEWVQKAHKVVVNSGESNYKSARVLVKTNLNLKLWAEILTEYHDPQLLDYLRFGYPLCVNYDTFQHVPSTVNYLSATRFPDDVNIYFATELAHNSTAGPFESVPFEKFHVSPSLTRPKSNDSRKVIVNLSYPEAQSVNSNIKSDSYDDYDFDLSYPSIDSIVDEIANVGKDVLLYKLDIS